MRIKNQKCFYTFARILLIIKHRTYASLNAPTTFLMLL